MHLIQLKQARLEVERIAAPDSKGDAKAPIVFLHEGLGSVALWKTRDGFWPQLVCAATGRAGVVYSRRGYGHSEDIADVRGAHRLQADYMHNEAWQVLPDLLQTLGITKPVLLGHSDGGTIALLHASRHPLSGCIVMAPHVMVEDVSIAAIEDMRESFTTGNLRERLARFHAHVDTAFWQWNDVWLSPAFRSFDIRQDCSHIACDVLALQGKDDAYGTMQQINDIQPSSGRITRHAIASCGHSPHRDQSAEVLRLVVDFLENKP
jgi:pimeloyl-ACP methyl ester carboxylesterase